MEVIAPRDWNSCFEKSRGDSDQLEGGGDRGCS